MKKLKLNQKLSKDSSNNGYMLNPMEKYVINIEEEKDFQMSILCAFEVMGAPLAIKNYHAWLFENGFSVEIPNPTNEFVSQYYGKRPLWITDYSMGIVVKDEFGTDYYIVMECSSKNKGYKHTIVILTPGGCL